MVGRVYARFQYLGMGGNINFPNAIRKFPSQVYINSKIKPALLQNIEWIYM